MTSYDGILGSTFFHKAGVILDYEKGEMVTGRISIPFFNRKFATRATPLSPTEEIYFLGENEFNNYYTIDSICDKMEANFLDEIQMFPLRKMEEEEEAAAYPLNTEDKISADQQAITDPEERINIIKSKQQLSDVETEEEIKAVDELLGKSHDLFFIDGDKFEGISTT